MVTAGAKEKKNILGPMKTTMSGVRLPLLVVRLQSANSDCAAERAGGKKDT